MWSEVARTHAIADCNAARMKLFTVAKDCCPTTCFAQKTAEHDDEDERRSGKGDSTSGFENDKKLTGHTLKLRSIGFGRTIVELRFKSLRRNGSVLWSD
jgi:hypothetical protein